jgi:regulator of protease activity HflC (stomatin/prohibitin superfamily)
MSDAIKPNVPVSAQKVARGLFRILGRILRNKWFWILGVPLIAVYIGTGSCTTYVPPNMVGVKQVYYGSSAGIHKEIFAPGLHFLTAGVERMHLFPHDIQVVNFSDSTSEVSRASRTAPAIKVQTSDGYNVVLDISVLFHIVDPYKIFTEAGPGRAYEDKFIVPRADRILRKTLGELNSEEFYAGPKRIDKARQAQSELSTELEPYGIKLDAVLVRRYTYDEKYQQIIEGRKIKDQTVFWREAEAKSAIETRKRDTIVAEGKANVEVELSRGEAEVQKIRAQADPYSRKQAAAGKLLVELAEAKGTQLETDALQGAGSENMVGIKMAELLRGVKVLVLASDGPNGLNPLDLESLMKKLEVK